MPVDLNPDAPHSPERTLALANLAADAVRVLNHATLPNRGGLNEPSDIYSLLGALGELAERFPQLFRRLETWLRNEQLAGHLEVSADGQTGGDMKLALLRVRDGLSLAGTLAREMGDALGKAQNAISDLRYVEAAE